MASTMIPLAPSGESFAHALTRAEAGRAAWLAVHGRLQARELMAIQSTEQHHWSWIGPDGVIWRALGVAGAWEAQTPDEVATLPDACRVALRDGVFGTAAATAMARCFGGAAFDPAAPGAPLGAPMPLARFVLPRWLLRQDPDGSTEGLALVGVEVADQAASLQARASAEWEALVAWAVGPVGPAMWHPARPVPSPGAQAAWEGAVASALAAIGRGEVAKVVLARAIPLQAEQALPVLPVFAALAARSPGTFRFCVADGERAFLGASPELLFRVSGRAFSADGLAGTAPRGATETEDAAFGDGLVASVKDQHEHQLVVSAIAEALRPLASSVAMPAAPGLKRLPTVQHLHTPITAVLEPQASLGALLSAMHPTPAVGGTPRVEAMAMIRELEVGDRGWYAGPVGWVGRDEAEFAVAIRSAYLQGAQAAVMAGAGIVAGSVPAHEWAETARKAAPFVRLLTGEVA
jgi:isochorismate synthase